MAIVLTLAAIRAGWAIPAPAFQNFVLRPVAGPPGLGHHVPAAPPSRAAQAKPGLSLSASWFSSSCALVVAELAWQLPWRLTAQLSSTSSHLYFLLRTFAISSIIIALAMRYLYVSSEWRRSIVLEAQARISALQALIRPHFLFNSMNTIASLTRTNPQQAEEAVEDLSDLLRASLSTTRDRTSLKEELEVAAMLPAHRKIAPRRSPADSLGY